MKKIILISISFSLLVITQAQQVVTRKTIPAEIEKRQSYQYAKPEVVSMPPVPVDRLLEEDRNNEKIPGNPYRFGYEINVSLDLKNSGNWNDLPDGSTVWALNIISEGAYSINLIFDEFYLPKGSELNIYNSDKTWLYGPVTWEQNLSTYTFATDIIKGESIIIEYIEPLHSYGKGKISISQVIHAYKNVFQPEIMPVYPKEDKDLTQTKGYGDSWDCHTDVLCEDDGYEDEMHSVALMIFGGYSCSGCLINTTQLEPENYFLTAEHCTDKGVNFGNYVFRFEYYNAQCDGNTEPDYVSYSGCSRIAYWDNGPTNYDSDFALLQFNQPPN